MHAYSLGGNVLLDDNNGHTLRTTIGYMQVAKGVGNQGKYGTFSYAACVIGL